MIEAGHPEKQKGHDKEYQRVGVRMKMTLYDWCVERKALYLLEEWDQERNRDVTPWTLEVDDIRWFSWVCGKGHHWKASVYSRQDLSGCPVCYGTKVLPGVNDLGTRQPELIKEWHPTKNTDVTPEELSPGSHRRVWWLCPLGHEYVADIAARVNGTGCPVCGGKKVVPGFNDLATIAPPIAAQWHPTKNGDLTPRAVTSQSHRAVWWLCPLGHEYKSPITDRVARSRGCPYCAGKKALAGFNDLASVDPEVAGQWHKSLNGQLSPQTVTYGSHRVVWWECAEGHVWKAAICARTGGNKTGCPVCAGQVKGGHLKRYERYQAEASLLKGTRRKQPERIRFPARGTSPGTEKETLERVVS